MAREREQSGVIGTTRGCTRCLMDDSVPGIRYDDLGVCHLCHVHDRLELSFGATSAGSDDNLARLVDRVRSDGRGKKFDCIVPLSGGADSSYSLYTVVKAGLRPLAVHFDNGWVSDIALTNMTAVTSSLGVPLKVVRYPREAMMDAYAASLRGSVPEVCLPCLIGIWSLPYKAAAEEGVRWVFHGSSPLTEGITPLSWSYGEGRYLMDLVRRFGKPETVEVVRAYSGLSIAAVAWSSLIRRTKIVMLPLYMNWDEQIIKTELSEHLGWLDGGKHSDCIYSKFRTHHVLRKFGYNLASLGPSALMRSGKLSRKEAQELAQKKSAAPAPEVEAEVLGRLGMTTAQYEEIMSLPPKSFRDYNTYYPFIKAMGPAIWIAGRYGLISEFVFEKYFVC